jgi:hypothetical protein
MDDGIKARFMTASAIHFGLRSIAGPSAGEAAPARRVQAENTHPEERSFCAELYRRICGRRSRKQRGTHRIRPWSLMPGN